MANFTQRLALVIGVILTLISLVNPTLRMVNLVLSTITLAVVTQTRNRSQQSGLVYLTHATGLAALISVIRWGWPDLGLQTWCGLLVLILLLEWVGSLGGAMTRRWLTAATAPPSSAETLWQRSGWHFGLVLAVPSFYGLFFSQFDPNSDLGGGLLWFLVPLGLTLVGRYTNVPGRRNFTLWLSLMSLVVAQSLTLWVPGERLLGVGVATLVMLVNTRCLQRIAAAVVTVGFGLSVLLLFLLEAPPRLPVLKFTDWLLTGAITVTGLWLLHTWLRRRSPTQPLARLYVPAVDGWAIALWGLTWVGLLLHTALAYTHQLPAANTCLVSSGLLGVAVLLRSWRQPTLWSLVAANAAFELVMAAAIVRSEGSILDLAISNMGLALLLWLGGEVWLTRQPSRDIQSGLRLLPLFYALLAMGLRWEQFTPWTGLMTLGAAVVGLGVASRPSPWRGLQYCSLLGITLAWYELVIYRLLKASGGALADGLIVLAGVAALITLVYWLLATQRLPWLRLNSGMLAISAHWHWGLGSGLLGTAILSSLIQRPDLKGLGMGISVLLSGYALGQGRGQIAESGLKTWVYLGLVEGLVTALYARLLWQQLWIFDPWIAAIACGVGALLLKLPWQAWGWPQQPWRRAGLGLPFVIVIMTSGSIHSISLLVVAAYYTWVARRLNNRRLTYLSVLLIDWSCWRWFRDLRLHDPLWYVIPLGLSLLYIAEVDPGLQAPESKGKRHLLRLFGIGLIEVIGLFTQTGFGLIPWGLSLVAIVAGLALRVRAYLYVGTAIFMLHTLYQLVLLIFKLAFLKWVIGILVGIAFIWVAGSFETRRDQVAGLVKTWLHDWDQWS